MSLSTGCVLNVDASAIESGISRDRNHHTLTPTDTTTVRGKAGKGTLFNGTTSFVDCGNDSSLDITEAITIEAWVKYANQDNIYFMCKDGVVGARQWGLGSSSNDGYVFLFNSNDDLSHIMGTSLTATTWMHLVATYDKNVGGNNFILHQNGVLSGTSMQTGDIKKSTSILRIGSGVVAAFFNGIISSAKIYNYALSPTEIRRSYLSKAYLYTPHPVRIP